jgi:hypothetical protein
VDDNSSIRIEGLLSWASVICVMSERLCVALKAEGGPMDKSGMICPLAVCVLL